MYQSHTEKETETDRDNDREAETVRPADRQSDKQRQHDHYVGVEDVCGQRSDTEVMKCGESKPAPSLALITSSNRPWTPEDKEWGKGRGGEGVGWGWGWGRGRGQRLGSR